MGFSLTTAFEEPKVPSAFACLVDRSEEPKVTGVPSYLVILSTKYWDEDSKLSYYGYRYYGPGVGRMLNRDPLYEHGGLHLFSFCKNEPVKQIDILGLKPCRLKPQLEIKYLSPEWEIFVKSGNLKPRSAGFFKGEPIVLKKNDPPTTCGFLRNKIEVGLTLSDCEGLIIMVNGGSTDFPVEFKQAHEMRHYEYYQNAYAEVETAVDQVNKKCECKPCYEAIISWLQATLSVSAYERARNDASNDFLDYPDVPEREEARLDISKWQNALVESMATREKAKAQKDALCN